MIIVTGGLVSSDPSLSASDAVLSFNKTLAMIAAAFPGI